MTSTAVIASTTRGTVTGITIVDVRGRDSLSLRRFLTVR